MYKNKIKALALVLICTAPVYAHRGGSGFGAGLAVGGVTGALIGTAASRNRGDTYYVTETRYEDREDEDESSEDTQTQIRTLEKRIKQLEKENKKLKKQLAEKSVKSEEPLETKEKQ